MTKVLIENYKNGEKEIPTNLELNPDKNKMNTEFKLLILITYELTKVRSNIKNIN